MQTKVFLLLFVVQVVLLAPCDALFVQCPSASHALGSSTTNTKLSALKQHHSRRQAMITLVASGLLPTASSRAETTAIQPCTVNNCVSTSSVKQLDLYAAPWVDEREPVELLAARLKGIFQADPALQVVENNQDRFFRVRAARNLCTDEMEFLINNDDDNGDNTILFRSQQIEGPDISDFGANRQRLEEIRKKLNVKPMGGTEMMEARREGVGDQLKAFWGFQSGSGYESILLEE